MSESQTSEKRQIMTRFQREQELHGMLDEGGEPLREVVELFLSITGENIWLEDLSTARLVDAIISFEVEHQLIDLSPN